MNFFGIGGFEFLLIGAIALFVLGPQRLMEGIRGGRKLYTDLKRQRDALQTMITDAIELEDLKKELDADGISGDIDELKNQMSLDQLEEEATTGKKPLTAFEDSSQKWQPKHPPVIVDSEVRDAIPDLDLGMGEEKLATSAPPEEFSEPEADDEPEADETSESPETDDLSEEKASS